jgi:hypothetical protein
MLVRAKTDCTPRSGIEAAKFVLVCVALLMSIASGKADPNGRIEGRLMSSWEGAMFCGENVQSLKGLDAFFGATNVERNSGLSELEILKRLGKNKAFSSVFKFDSDSVRTSRLSEPVFESGKKTNKTKEVFLAWGQANVINGAKSTSANFCFVSKNSEYLDLKGILTNVYSKHLTVLSSNKSNPFLSPYNSDPLVAFSDPEIPGHWMLAIHSSEFKKYFKKAQP